MNPHRLDLAHRHSKQLEQQIRQTLPSLYKLRQTANVALPDSNEAIFYRQIEAFIHELEARTSLRPAPVVTKMQVMGTATGRVTHDKPNFEEVDRG